MNWSKFWGIAIRVVFLFAFAAFLRASIDHIADFYTTFENGDKTTGYTLAIALDGTNLVLAIAIMFYRKNMTTWKVVGVWAFIVMLTAFSWVVNWQYAVAEQAATFTDHLDPFWKDINPVIASSFAGLNIVYSLVSEVFNHREKTQEELQEEYDNLTGEKAQLKAKIAKAKKSEKGAIQMLKEKALEVASAGKEVAEQFTKKAPEIPVAPPENLESNVSTEVETEEETYTSTPLETSGESEVEIEAQENEEVTFHLVDTGEHEKLDEIGNRKRNKNTDQLSSKTSSLRNLAVKKPVTKEQKILQLLSRNPQLNPTEIAEKVGVTRQYVSQVKSKMATMNQPVKVNNEEMVG